jgi:hypothetical protein
VLRLIKTFYELFTLYGAVSALAMDNYSLRAQGLNWPTIHMWLTMAHLDHFFHSGGAIAHTVASQRFGNRLGICGHF